MRGSPLLRFIFLAIALAATGAGLARVTATRGPVAPPSGTPVAGKAAADSKLVPFRLLLSAQAAEVTLDGGTAVRPVPGDGAVSGTLEMDPGNPQVAVTIRWKNATAAGEHRFAKLTLEIPGQPTFQHVFEADGDIDDFIELPLPANR